MYTGVAQYLTHRHTPNYSHVTFGYSNKDRFCTDEKLKLFEQEIIRTDAGICWDEEEDDGSKTYYKFDLTQCNDAGTDILILLTFFLFILSFFLIMKSSFAIFF